MSRVGRCDTVIRLSTPFTGFLGGMRRTRTFLRAKAQYSEKARERASPTEKKHKTKSVAPVNPA